MFTLILLLFLVMIVLVMIFRFVHGTCDPDADLVTYQQRKDVSPEYEYVCLVCKNEPKKRKDCEY